MKKWIACFLLAGLAGCSSNTTTDNKPAEPAAPAATPVPEPAPTEPPPVPTAADANKDTPAPAAAPKAEVKPDVASKPASNRKPGVYANFETSMGNFTAELNEKEAPITVANFMGLANGTIEWTDPAGKKQKKPFYDGLIFHRIIDGFMIQGGDPKGTGEGGPGFTIKDEYNNLKHDKVGTLAMARTSQPDSAGSQFYITVAAPTFLDNQKPPYVVFGQVTEGLDVVLKMGKVPTGGQDRPVTPPVIKKLRVERVK